jgi:predicted DCC family thiol-disulfide oxidoreductase YuxK
MDAAALNQRTAPSWNPFICSGTGMPVPLLVMAKLIALSLLLTNHVRLLPDPFLPFLPFLESVPGEAFQWTLRIAFLVSATALLLNRRVRLFSILLGATLLLAVLSSKAYYGNNKTACGLLLVLAGLNGRHTEPWLIRLQIALIYFGAGLNKLLDPDWLSGVFFEHWAGARLQHSLYLAVSAALPPLAFAKLLGWSTILIELFLPAGLLFARTRHFAIWLSVLFQSALLLFTGHTFTMFFFAMQASMLAFAPWPREALAIYDRDCGFCDRSRRFMMRIDWERLIRWEPLQSGIGDRWGIAAGDLMRRMYLVLDGRHISSGFRAWKLMLLANPLLWFALAILIAAPPATWANWRRLVVAAALVFFLPLFNPIGEAIYNLVARNRHRLSANPTCSVPADR